jgi:hypothetical protein
LTVDIHIYGRPNHTKETKEEVRRVRNAQWEQERPKYKVYSEAVDAGKHEYAASCLAEIKAARKEMDVKVVEILKKSGGRRTGVLYHLRPLEEQIRGLELVAPLIGECNCGCPRNKRAHSRMFSEEVGEAMKIFNKGGAGLNLAEFLTEVFGKKDLRRMLKLK